MENQPNKIFLQTALKEYGEVCEDFNSLDSNLISWCSDKIYEDDLGYLSFNFILARIKELKSKKIDTLTKNGQYEFNINSSIINELENLLE